MTVTIPVKTKYDGSGFDQAERDAKKAQKAAVDATKAQLAEHRKVMQLTAKFDKDSADAAKKAKETREKQIEQYKEIGATAAGLAALTVKVGYDAVQAAKESIAAENELQAALNSTGQAAGAYKEQLTGLATELEKTTNFTDEEVQHAEALLLTFTKIGRQVMPDAARAVADVAELMDGDLQGAAIQVGKALNDPINGISALTRVGVSFTQHQKDQIEAMVKAGDVAGAQRLILAELNKEFGGQAEAARRAAGGMKDLEVSVGNLQESVGKLLLAIGDAGVTKFLSGFIDQLTAGADAWTKVVEAVEILTKAQDKLTAENRKAAPVWAQNVEAATDYARWLNPINALMDKGIKVSASYMFAQDQLAAKVQEVAQEEQAAKDAATQHTGALNQNTDATEENADTAKDLAKKLEAANEARRKVAGDLLDIQDKAAKDTAETWDDYFKDEQKAWKEHSKNVERINADSEKERIRIQKELAKELSDINKNLAKDLAKVDKDLARDEAKLKKDTDRQVARIQQDAARQERQQRRQRQIEAKGDQRLFDFEMRQLAAEGEFNAILAAKERRAIEQQIEAEKQQAQDQTEEENRRVEIERTRQDAADRLAEMRAEAEERRQELQEQAEERRQQAIEQAAEEEQRRQEELAQALADEEQNYQDRLQALREARDEKLAEIEQTKQESIAKLAEEIAANKDLTLQGMEETKAIAEEFGPETGRVYAEGINEAFERGLRITEIANAAMRNAAGARAGTTNPAHPTVPTGIGQSTHARSAGAQRTTTGTPFPGFASGGSFMVHGAGGTDSQLVSFLATPGERVTVSPPGTGGKPAINIYANGVGADRLAAILDRKVQEGINEYHETVIIPWSNGV